MLVVVLLVILIGDLVKNYVILLKLVTVSKA